jgi:hypothetical protein
MGTNNLDNLIAEYVLLSLPQTFVAYREYAPNYLRIIFVDNVKVQRFLTQDIVFSFPFPTVMVTWYPAASSIQASNTPGKT